MNPSATQPPANNPVQPGRLGAAWLLFILLIVEYALLATFLEVDIQTHQWATRERFFAYDLIRGLPNQAIIPILALILFCLRLLDSAELRESLTERIRVRTQGRSWSLVLIAQLLSALLFFTVSYLVLTQLSERLAPTPLVQAGWLASGLLLLVLSMQCLLQWRHWFSLAVEEFRLLLATAVIVGLILLLVNQSSSLWLTMATLTMDYVAQLLIWIYGDIVYEPVRYLVGIDGFRVFIAESCSGYEGIGLVTGVLASYYWIFRRHYRFPQVLILFPLGWALIWFSNILRITGLIILGAEWSEDVALGGFHSNAGILLFLLVSGMVIFLGSKWRWISAREQETNAKPLPRLSLALLAPIIGLLTATLITGLMVNDFQWFYPLRVLVVVLILGWLFRDLWDSSASTSPLAVVAGLLGFAVWLLLVPEDPIRSGQFKTYLDSMTPALMWGWLLFRIIGACITVPIAEELAFRGYFLQRLSGAELSLNAKLMYSVPAIAATSVFFGALHSAWLAGAIVGILYAAVRVHTGHLYNAIIAHAITNIALTVYVVWLGKWSLW